MADKPLTVVSVGPFPVPKQNRTEAGYVTVVKEPAYKASEPEEIGRIPARTELTVLKADDPGTRTIGFKVYELTGTNIYRPPGEFPTDPQWAEMVMVPENLITTKDGLREGEELLVQGLWGLCRGTVVFEDGEPSHLISGDTIFVIDFVNDRKCEHDPDAPPRWVCCGSGSLKAFQKMEVKR